MVRVLIYAASGLIGSNLIKSLLSFHEFEVSAVTHSGLKRTLVEDLITAGVYPRLRTYRSTQEIRSDSRFDIIYHLGYSSQPSIFISDSSNTFARNIIVAPELVSRLCEGGTIIFASSSEIYNGCAVTPCSEAHLGNFGNPLRRDYMLSKLVTERYLDSLETKGINSLSLRISLTYGPYVDFEDSRVMYKFIRDAIKFGEIRVLGDPEARRSYLFVDDLLEVDSKLRRIGSRGIFNVAGTEEISIRDLAQIIGQLLSVKVHFFENEIQSGAPQNVRVDSNLLKQTIGEFEVTSLEVGLKRTIDWFLNLGS